MSAQTSVRSETLTPVASSQRALALALAGALGLALLFLSGFAAPAFVHNAAHDWRHAHNFPCH